MHPESPGATAAFFLRANDPQEAARHLVVYCDLPSELTWQDLQPLLPFLAERGLGVEAERGFGWIVVHLEEAVPVVVDDAPTVVDAAKDLVCR